MSMIASIGTLIARIGPAIPRIGRVAALLAAVASLVPALQTPARALSLLSCSFGLSDFVFGPVDVLPGAAIQTNAQLTASCLNVALTGTMSVCLAFPARAMTAAGQTLAWDVFGPSPSTTSWSNTTAIVIPLTAVLGTSTAIAIPAAIAGLQTAIPPGAYGQTMTVTVSYGTSGCSGGLTSPSSMTVHATATVIKSCLLSVTNLGFASAGDLTTIIDGQGQLTAQCSAGAGYTLALDGGLSGATDPTARQMTAGSDHVQYGLYQNAARSVPWGSTIGTNTLGGTGSAAVQTVPIYGRVPVQPTPPPATYSDTVVLSVAY